MFPFLLVALGAALLPAQDVRSGWYRGAEVRYRVVEGRALYQGDIELDAVEHLPSTKVGGRSASSIVGDRYRWPNATVPYIIDMDVPNTQRILDAIQHWNDRTPIKIIPRSAEGNYVRFVRTPNTGVCSSNVGMLGGPQRISLDDACTSGPIIHELGHAVGLWHEQSRTDRDFYVKLLVDNIDKRYLSDFDQQSRDGVDIGFYDYASIMHYDSYSFSRNGQPSLQTLPPGIPIGQRAALSDGDVDAVRRLYQSEAASTTVTTFPTGLSIIVDGQTFTAPQTFNWTPGSTHTIATPSTQGGGGIRYAFGRWSDGGAVTHTITVSPLYHVYTANFVRQLLLQVGSNGGGQAAANPASADGYYPDGSLVTVTATPGPGNTFTSWTGAFVLVATAGLPTARFVMRNSDTRYLANFTSSSTVTVTSDPPGRTVMVDGVSITTPRVFLWEKGSPHGLNVPATVQSGPPSPVQYKFKGWADGGDTQRTVTFDGTPATYKANFDTQYLLVTASTPFGAGSIDISPSGDGGYYSLGTQLRLSASPSGGARFLGWTNDVATTDNPALRLVDDQLLITANFAFPRSFSKSNVVNAANYLASSVSPGSMVTIFGLEIGPVQEAFAHITAGRFDTNIGGTRVLFDGIAAPMLYAGRNQVSAIVPFGIGGATTRVTVETAAVLSSVVSLDVAPSSPGIFTQDASGRGPGSILNENLSVNGSANPAVKGSTIVIYATGGGLMIPPLADGQIVNSAGNTQLPVKVFIASRECPVDYAGPAPTLVAGALQVNARLPSDLPSGDLPIAIQVGDVRSPAFVTVSVQ